jgi:CRP/FNR family cyclic AMP-dependent transcriptional regulator
MISDSAFQGLRTTSLFAGFTDEQLEAVPQAAIPRKFAAGDMIVKEGERGARSLFVVLEGEVEIRVGGKVLRTDGPGCYFGEMALLTDEPRSADVVARSEVTALQLSRDHLRGLIHSNPDVALAMLAEMSRRLRLLTDLTNEMLSSSPEAAEAARKKGVTAADHDPSADFGPTEWGILFGD